VEFLHAFIGHLFVEVAGDDEQDGFEGFEPAFLAGGKLGLEANLEGGPDEEGKSLATAGVVSEHHAVVKGGPGIILALESFEPEAA
jgi:hypothetical protein